MRIKIWTRRHGRRFNGIYLSGNPVRHSFSALRDDWVASSHNSMDGDHFILSTKVFAETVKQYIDRLITLTKIGT